MTGDDWTEKYRPRTLSEIVGNPGAAEQIRKWAEQWAKGKPTMRAVTVTGPPGIGKTSAAEALALDMGWDIVEMNASDQRNADAIRNVALTGSKFSTFGADGSFLSTADGRMKLIVLDEADCLYGNADRGAMPVINELVKTSDQPVMLIANDGYALNRKSSTIKDQTLQVAFRRPTAASIAKVVRRVCASEGVEIEDAAVMKIAENASGDIRAALRDLQSLASAKKHVTEKDASVLSGREDRSELFDVVGAIYRRRD
ncbi:MAG: AAA family ATPase, partial [Thermoplasmata archaeon]|nr:AAA family ATPase [Thermoplasmata archaeon]